MLADRAREDWRDREASKAMAAMMEMVKFNIATLEAAAKESRVTAKEPKPLNRLLRQAVRHIIGGRS